ncbi:MAG: nucleotidyl transferase AbiEii/AbiGii toxin family protein [Chloroflexi bacterium]|nr:nucleotidyl transferase AbiEii/AbiGii toxin family protein [Chloroflexota bacterium]
MFEQVLPESTRSYLALLAREKISQPFYLGGGTAVALHLGHRLSVDLDFFTPDHFDVHYLENALQEMKTYRRERLAEDTLLGALEDLRISFFRYRYDLLEQPIEALGTKILQLSDLAAMKIEAISQRNVKRDFIDLYCLARQTGITPEKAIAYHRSKYAGLDVNLTHIVLSLGYFEEADADIMPSMLISISWEDVKKYFAQQSKELIRKLAV